MATLWATILELSTDNSESRQYQLVTNAQVKGSYERNLSRYHFGITPLTLTKESKYLVSSISCSTPVLWGRYWIRKVCWLRLITDLVPSLTPTRP